MPTQDSLISTLARIRIKVRRLTRSPSPAQLSDDEIDQYVNTFVLYDFPAHITLASLMTTLVFYSKPNVDVYATTITDVDDPLYNFSNKFSCVYGPAYIAGHKAYFTKSREDFYNKYPLTNTITQIGTGDGANDNFTGTLIFPILQNNVTFTTVSDTDNEPLTLVDVPDSSAMGHLVVPGTEVDRGYIDYIAGIYEATFPAAPVDGTTVNCQTVPYIAGQPSSMLFHNNEFTLRPVPDQPYRITVEAQIRPVALLAGAQTPELSRWWEYISYGCSKKIFEDRMDMESVAMIMPEFKKQETLILRPTILQQSSERVSTIFEDK